MALTPHRHQVRMEPLRMMTADEILAAYESGERDFGRLNADGIQLVNVDLEAATFIGSSLVGSNFEQSNLMHVQFKGANLSGAKLSGASMNVSDSPNL